MHLLMYKPLPFILIILAGFGLFLVHPTDAKASLYVAPRLYWHSLTIQKIIFLTKQQTSIKPSVTPQPTTSSSLTITPTSHPQTPTILTSAPIPTTQPTTPPAPTTTTPATNDAQGYIMNEINKYRASQGLSAVQTSGPTCSFAATRATEIAANFNHDGFNNRISSKTLPYSSWSSVTENIAQTSDYKQVVSMWANSAGHAANMRADTPYVCVVQNGSFFAYEGMKP